ncbi:MAG: L-lactate dehydrogenase [Anaerolineales bacterium]|nr:L-lactate dehydrogenase [Anaerolineales bacterium]
MSKIGIVGTGMVGATAAYALAMRGIGGELMLVDKNQVRAKAEAADILHAVPFAHPVRVSAGDYPELAGCRVVIIAAGVGQKPGETRLQLLERNAAIFKSMIPDVLKYAPEAVLVVATNPVDIMTHLTARFAAEFGVPASRVFGSGTTLDTARFRALLGNLVGVAANNVHGYVIGEHGDSEVLAWSRAAVGVIPLEDFCRTQQIELNEAIRQEIDQQVRRAAYTIIEGKGATYYGIGSALARIVSAILDDQRAVLTVCSPVPTIVGVSDVTLALPHIVGGQGVLGTLPLPLSPTEEAALQASAQIVRAAIDELDKVVELVHK